jgi:hypothetical protein
LGCRDDQNFPNVAEHQSAQGVVDHGLVVDREQLFGHCLGHRVQASSGTASQDDAFSAVCMCHGDGLFWRGLENLKSNETYTGNLNVKKSKANYPSKTIICFFNMNFSFPQVLHFLYTAIGVL